MPHRTSAISPGRAVLSRSMSAVGDEGAIRKRLAPSPPWGSSSKCSRTIMNGGQSSSSMAPVDPTLVGDEAPTGGEDAEDMMVMGAMLSVDDEGCCPSLEVSRGEDRDSSSTFLFVWMLSLLRP